MLHGVEALSTLQQRNFASHEVVIRATFALTCNPGPTMLHNELLDFVASITTP